MPGGGPACRSSSFDTTDSVPCSWKKWYAFRRNCLTSARPHHTACLVALSISRREGTSTTRTQGSNRTVRACFNASLLASLLSADGGAVLDPCPIPRCALVRAASRVRALSSSHLVSPGSCRGLEQERVVPQSGLEQHLCERSTSGLKKPGAKNTAVVVWRDTLEVSFSTTLLPLLLLLLRSFRVAW